MAKLWRHAGRASILGLWLALLAGLAGAPAYCQSDGSLSVPIRESSGNSGLVVEEVRLYRASHALVIGIDNYTNGWPRLSMAVNDARIMAEELKRQGFDVVFRNDLKSAELDAALREFFIVKGDDPEARLFLWYAGHGHTEGGEGFLIPADAPRADLGTRFTLAALPMRRFGEYVRLAKAKHVYAVFDSCFSGTIFEAERGLPPRAITRATALPVRQFLTSGDANQTVFDNGTFRELFLRALRGEEGADANGDGFVTGTEVGLFLSDRITNLTRSRQTPRYGKLLDKDLDRGDFVFRVDAGATVAMAPPATMAPPAATGGSEQTRSSEALMVEMSFWDAIKSSTNPGDYKAYLEAYPNGRFAALARVRAGGATPPVATPPAPTPPAPAAAAPSLPPVAATRAAPAPDPAAAEARARAAAAAKADTEAKARAERERQASEGRKAPPAVAAVVAAPPVVAPPSAAPAVAAPALPPGAFRPPAVGTRFHFDNGGFLQVAGVDGLTLHLVNALGQRHDVVACCWEGDPLYLQGQNPFKELWPLKLGRSVQFTVTGHLAIQTWVHYLRVVRQERIEVPAGAFDTFVIEWEQKGVAQNNLRIVQTYYYVPELGFPVRMDVRVLSGLSRARSWRLTRIDRPQS